MHGTAFANSALFPGKQISSQLVADDILSSNIKEMEKQPCPSPQRFCNLQMEIFMELFFIISPARHSLVFIVHQNQIIGGHRIGIFS
ncbi:hypothetical protein MRB53_032919 [Persea americana]|uniref:Uncharacterized protein n=1 Tax=Persea americana TaxID=3435 RepID=A0ACC2KUD3_PERAE|nr:hypothetical protein MRB53_032919 [Persea americana]